MKIALVAPSAVPFTVGGAEKLWWGLLQSVNQFSGHQMELIKIPSPERTFVELMDSYQRFSELDLSHFDRVISTKYPAWMVQHPDHHLYLQHTLRGLYDTYPWPERAVQDPFTPEAWPGEKGQRSIKVLRHHPSLRALRVLLHAPPERAQLPELFGRVQRLATESTLPANVRAALLAFPGPLTRAIVHHLDAIALAPHAISRYAAISRNVTERVDYFPEGVPVKVIHHPSDLPLFEGEGRDYFFTVSRLDGPKRLDLLIRAFLRTELDMELRIAGTGPMEHELKALAAEDDRIRFLGFLRDSEIIEHYRDALAVPFLPYDEDYGLITVEAMGAGKPVITCCDSGGVNEFVKHGISGWSVAPEAHALADAFVEAATDRATTARMGEHAQKCVAHVNWHNTVRELLDDTPHDSEADRADSAFPIVVSGRQSAAKVKAAAHWLVVNTYSVYPPMGGGQSRMYHLYRHIAAELGVQITLLVLSDNDDQAGRREIAPGLFEHRIPLTTAQRTQRQSLGRVLSASVDDIAAIHGWQHNPAFIDALKHYSTSTTLALCAHPYLVHALMAHYHGPWLYEAHNVELDLKRAIIAQALEKHLPEAEEAIKAVDEAERLACQQSHTILACSETDLQCFRHRYNLPADKGVVIANCANIEQLPFISMAARYRWQQRLGQHRRIALFLGSWHGPNLEAADFICRNLAPHHPEVLFYLAGSLCQHPDFLHLPPNVRSLGRVSDAELQVLLASADVALNPMFSGSGSNLKMLDYTASGVPVLTTPFGNRGLDFDEHQLWLAERDAFSATLRALLSADDCERDTRVTHARARTEACFTWPSVVGHLIGVIPDDAVSGVAPTA
ncbi:glycosyltransferase family 4 protein [Larsenimonas salina]|uniref:glycosyltransferase family 4 protein n=1 Tax=Larsenimonas salina TaxID=1295565 RepID=UPI00207405DC|nr:glycosyltransferase family 4 protein [Larsenimonas salina]MCM5704927.1 glycosyltransferase family 4 protein [Larsenimonas salina]